MLFSLYFVSVLQCYSVTVLHMNTVSFLRKGATICFQI